MKVSYCDMCAAPIKEGTSHYLYVASPKEDVYNSTSSYLDKLDRETREICPTCKELFEKIFEYRLEGLVKLTQECAGMFNLPSVEPKKPKEIKKKK